MWVSWKVCLASAWRPLFFQKVLLLFVLIQYLGRQQRSSLQYSPYINWGIWSKIHLNLLVSLEQTTIWTWCHKLMNSCKSKLNYFLKPLWLEKWSTIFHHQELYSLPNSKNPVELSTLWHVDCGCSLCRRAVSNLKAKITESTIILIITNNIFLWVCLFFAL